MRSTVYPYRALNAAFCKRATGLHALLVSGLVLACFSSTSAQTYRDRVLADSPTYLWSLDDPVDGGIVGNDGSAIADATYMGGVSLGDSIVPGEPGNPSTAFNGIDASIPILDADEINVTNGPWTKRSWSMWFNADDATTGTEQVIWEQGGVTRGVNFYVHEGRLYAGAWNRGNDGDGTTAPWISGEGDIDGGNLYLSAPIESGVSYQATLVMDGDDTGKSGFLRGYLNGVQFGEKTGVGQLFNHGDDTGIGAMTQNTYFDTRTGSGTGNYFAGRIDEVALFNTALTQAQILAQLEIDSVPSPGDFNGDGAINQADFEILGNNMAGHLDGPVGLAEGDMNFDGQINLDDFSLFIEAFPGVAQGHAIPEPASVVLMSLMLIGLAATRLPNRDSLK